MSEKKQTIFDFDKVISPLSQEKQQQIRNDFEVIADYIGHFCYVFAETIWGSDVPDSRKDPNDKKLLTRRNEAKEIWTNEFFHIGFILLRDMNEDFKDLYDKFSAQNNITTSDTLIGIVNKTKWLRMWLSSESKNSDEKLQ